MFSKTCEYAIRAIIFIAQTAVDGKKVSIKAIAKGIGSPEHFIAKILQELGKKGLLQSAKGPHGGFYIDEETFGKSIGDVVMAIDGDKLFVDCALGLSFCSEANPCPMHHRYVSIKKEITQMLHQTKLLEFKNNPDAGRLSNILNTPNNLCKAKI